MTFGVVGTGEFGVVGAGAYSGTPVDDFDPLTQVTPLHAVWASDPDWTPPADGAAVDSMRNVSGGGDPASTLTARPLYRASTAVLGGRPTVQFDGVNDVLQYDLPLLNQPYKVLFVYAFTAGMISVNPFGDGSGTTTGFGVTGGGKLYWSSGTVLASALDDDTNGHVVRASMASSSAVVKQDGVQIASGACGASGLSWFRLGAGGETSPSRFAPCHIAFAGIYSGATADADLDQLATDLATYYGL